MSFQASIFLGSMTEALIEAKNEVKWVVCSSINCCVSLAKKQELSFVIEPFKNQLKQI